MRAAAATDSATAAPWLRWLKVSLAATAKCTSSRPRREEPVISSLVQDEARVDDSGPAHDRGDDLLGAGHLREPGRG